MPTCTDYLKLLPQRPRTEKEMFILALRKLDNLDKESKLMCHEMDFLHNVTKVNCHASEEALKRSWVLLKKYYTTE